MSDAPSSSAPPLATARLSAPVDTARAAALLKDGALVAFPTETVYGLGGHGLRPDVVAAIFAAKGRPSHNPVILHVASPDAAFALWTLTAAQRARAQAAMDAFWPGPLTLVAPRHAGVPDVVTAGLDKVAVRLPAHPVARAVLAAAGVPIAAPSANASSRPSPTTAAHVARTLDGRIHAVLDGGPCAVGVESTVLDITPDVPRVLRPGGVSAAALRRVFGACDTRAPGQPTHMDAPQTDNHKTDNHKTSAPAPLGASPGLLARHYAPALPAVTLAGPDALDAAWMTADSLLLRAAAAADRTARLGPRPAGRTLVLPDGPEAAAAALYALLYEAEAAGAALHLEALPAGDAWHLLRDRLRRAATDTRGVLHSA